VPLSAVLEALRHAGYLPAEADALVGILTDRGLVAQVAGGLRPVVAGRAECERALREIDSLSSRLKVLLGAAEVPDAPEGKSLRDLWAHLDRLRRLLQDTLDAATQQVQRQGERMAELLGAVRAEAVPAEWTKSDLATHLRGIAKLLGRTRDALARGLQREAGRLACELASARDGGEAWAVVWRKRAAAFERVWRNLEQRVSDFVRQAAALRAWLPLNDRLASLSTLGAKVAGSDPAVARSVRELVAELRVRFATEHWGPVHAHAEVASRLSALEAQAQGLLFSRVQAFLGELDALRVRFNDFLVGPAPQIAVSGGAGGDEGAGPNLPGLYAWALQGFVSAAEQLRSRRVRSQPWRHPTRKSQGWTDIDDQLTRALAAAHSALDSAAVKRVGELLLLMRQGFVVAGADRGEAVYEGADGAVVLRDVGPLLAEGKIRVRVEWISSNGAETGAS
jgi:hypothetical protein